MRRRSRRLTGVDNVVYGQKIVQRLLALGGVLRRVGIGLILAFVGVASIIISNTIRLTVFARRREIAIMQLVGATNTYIRLPFICEGLLDGLIGALVALAIASRRARRRSGLGCSSTAVGSTDGDAGRRRAFWPRTDIDRSRDRRVRILDLRRTLLTDVKRLTLHRCRVVRFSLQRCSASAAASGPTLEQRIAAQRARAQQLQMRLHAKRVELGEATLHYQDLQQQLNQTNAAIGEVNGRIDSLAAQQESTQRRIAWNSIQLDAARRSLLLHDELLKRRLVDIYEYGDLSYVDALIAARSFSEFVERWEDLRLLIAANQRAVRARKAAEARVASIEAELEGTRLQLQQQEQAQDEARSQLGSLADERRNLVTLAGMRRRSVATQVAEMEDLSAAEEASLEGLILERERELESQQRGGRNSRRRRSSWRHRHVFVAGHRDDHIAVRLALQSIWGCAGVPSGARHRRADRTTVTAAAGGTVIMAQWYGGYGNYILIDHGGGYSTGYGHLSAIYVTTGQSVQRGQAIGAVGSTGQSTGPHLHFEVRIAGKPVDPAPRLH